MDWDQFDAWVRQYRGPCDHHPEPGCWTGCAFMDKCDLCHNFHGWNDRPTGHCNPPPMNFCPPKPPLPIPGESPMECANRLYAEISATMKQCGELNAKTEHMLHDLHEYGLRNGAYWGPDVVRVENGYNAEDSSPYTVVRIRDKDHYGCHVQVKMHLAYSNTTNSGIKEKITDASLYELAQIMVPATASETGWTGYVSYMGAPLPSDKSVPAFTYGFTRSGHLKVYSDTFLNANPDALKRDTIVDSMGCLGVLIKDGKATTGGDTALITDYGEKAARVILGQNYYTHETMFLIVGNWGEGYPGMTAEHCVEVLKGYGCSCAVQICSGNGVAALNQGAQLVPPYNNTVPEGVAMLYISKKDSFKNEIQTNLAYLTQLMNQLKFRAGLTDGQIADLLEKLNQEIEDRQNGDGNLQAGLEAEIRDREQAVTELQSELNALTEKFTQLDTELDAEVQRATTRENELDAAVKNETKRAEGAEGKIQQELDTEKSRAEGEEERIQGELDAFKEEIGTKVNTVESSLNETIKKIDDEIKRSTEQDKEHTEQLQTLKETLDKVKHDVAAHYETFSSQIETLDQFYHALQADVDEIKHVLATYQTQLTALDSALAEVLTALANVETAFNSLKELIAQLSDLPGRVTGLETKDTEHDREIAELKERMDQLDMTPITDPEVQDSWDKGGNP